MKIWPISLGEVTAALPLDVVCILIIGKVPKYISFTFLIRYKYLQPSSYSLFWPESEKKDRGAVLERLGVNPFLSSLSYGEFKGQLSAYALHRYPCNLIQNVSTQVIETCFLISGNESTETLGDHSSPISILLCGLFLFFPPPDISIVHLISKSKISNIHRDHPYFFSNFISLFGPFDRVIY